MSDSDTDRLLGKLEARADATEIAIKELREEHREQIEKVSAKLDHIVGRLERTKGGIGGVIAAGTVVSGLVTWAIEVFKK